MTIRIPVVGVLASAFIASPLAMAPAHASFAGSAALTTTVGTATVAAPATVTGNLTCGWFSATMQASWTPSTSERVSGYLVTAYFSNGSTQTAQVGPTATGWSAPTSTFSVLFKKVQYSVTTLTSYGWTAESPRTAWSTC